jgi:hypothetical protein
MRSFLLGILPPPCEVVKGQDNRVAEPATPDFVVMTPIHQSRLSFNVDVFADCAFIASISTAGVLSISQMLHGVVAVGNQLLGVGIPPSTFVSGSLSGTGGVGTYQLSGTIGAFPSAKMATGVFLALEPIELTIQCDVHGPNSTDNAHIISTLFRDQYAVDAFSAFGTAPPGWGPIPFGGTLPQKYVGMMSLYADEPTQHAFVNAEQQYEYRWTVDCCVQTNAVVTVARDFADTLVMTLLEADVSPVAQS